MNGTHRYKPAPLAAPIELEMNDDRIVLRDAHGRTRHDLSLAGVRRVRWYQQYANRMLFRTLELETGSGRVKLHQAARAAAGTGNTDLRGYMGAVRAVLAALATHRPELEVEQGAPALQRWFHFSLTALVSLVPLFPLGALLDRRDAAELWWAAALLGGLTLIGLVFAWINRPWRSPERRAPQELLTTLTTERAT